jgi:urease accessory protein
MLLIENIVGRGDEAAWEERLAGLRVDKLQLDQWEAQKNRLRKKTAGGIELGVALARHNQLRDGDILHWDEAAGTAIVVEITLKEVMVIDLSGTSALSPELIVQTCFELGHALGNQHWPAVVKGTRAYVPLTVDRKVMDSVMRTHKFEHVTYSFIKGAEVIPYLAPHESRRLFGGADATPHSHLPSMDTTASGDQSHGPGHGPAYIHTHGDGAPHAHTHSHAHSHADGVAHTHGHAHTHEHPHSAAPKGSHQHAELHGSFVPHTHPHGETK